MHSKTSVKRPLSKRPKIGFQDHLLLNAGQRYCRMLQGEHSAILLTFIKVLFVMKICFVDFWVVVLLRFYCTLVLKDCYYLGKQCRPRWNTTNWEISSGSSLFAKVYRGVSSMPRVKRLDITSINHLPWATSANRSFRVSCFPDTSTAETLTENLAPVWSFCSLMSLKSQAIAQGTIPRVCGPESWPIIVKVLPETS